MISQHTGQAAEQMALDYLMDKGLKLINRNYRCRLGEIDIIMHDGCYLVFIEVRSRSSMNFGGGIASITDAKRKKIIKTASYYLLYNPLKNEYSSRFDVVSIDGKSKALTWIKDAFGVDY